jgi:hypothetical protein
MRFKLTGCQETAGEGESVEVFDNEKLINQGRAIKARQRKFDKEGEGSSQRDRYSLQVPEFPERGPFGN